MPGADAVKMSLWNAADLLRQMTRHLGGTDDIALQVVGNSLTPGFEQLQQAFVELGDELKALSADLEKVRSSNNGGGASPASGGVAVKKSVFG
jgi:hypothetical protein